MTRNVDENICQFIEKPNGPKCGRTKVTRAGGAKLCPKHDLLTCPCGYCDETGRVEKCPQCGQTYGLFREVNQP